MRTRMLVAVGSLAVIAALSGCSPSGETTSPPSTPPASTAPSETSGAPSTAPETPPVTAEEQVVTLTVEGITVDGGKQIPYKAGADVLDVIRGLMGPLAEEPTAPDEYGLTVYDWGTVRVTLRENGTAGVWIGSGDIDGVTFQAPEGVEIGWTRDEALAAGAKDVGYDGDGDGKSDELMIGMREVPGTQSLVNPGKTGVEYVMLGIEKDAVAYILSDGNDFSDI